MGQFIVAAGQAVAANAQYIQLAAAAASTALSVKEARTQKREGARTQQELNRQAEQEKIAATDREGQRRRRLNQILGTTIAETGARGLEFEGSPQAVATAEIEQAQLEESGTKVADLSRISQLRRAGKAAKIRGKNAARGTLLSAAADASVAGIGIAKSRPPPTKKKKKTAGL